MTVALERIDSAPPIDQNNLDFFILWLGVFVDVINENLSKIEQSLNNFDSGIVIPSFTSAEITTLSATAANGTMWYATDGAPPNVVIKINGSLVQLTTAPFP